MNVGILVTSRRPHLIDSAAARARATGYPIVVMAHGFIIPGSPYFSISGADTYQHVVSRGLRILDMEGIEFAVKWDDHDEYPEGHVETVAAAYDGRPVLGRCRVRRCSDGKIIRTAVSLCAGGLPTRYVPSAGPSGRIGDMIGVHDVVNTRAVKLACGDWSWHDANQHRCDHVPLGSGVNGQGS